MTAKVIWITLTLLLILGFAIMRYRAKIGALPIEPHAAEEIEKAKRR